MKEPKNNHHNIDDQPLERKNTIVMTFQKKSKNFYFPLGILENGHVRGRGSGTIAIYLKQPWFRFQGRNMRTIISIKFGVPN